MTIQQTIASLDNSLGELSVHTAHGEWEFDTLAGEAVIKITVEDGYERYIVFSNNYDIIKYIVALHNALPTLRNAALEAERYKRAGEDAMKENMVQQLTGWSHAAQGFPISELVTSAGLKKGEWESIKKDYYIDFLTEKDIKEIEDTLFCDRQAVEQKEV